MTDFTELKCPNCNGQMQLIDEKSGTYACPFCECQVKFNEAKTQNYNINNNFIVADSVSIGDKASTENLWNKYHQYIQLHERYQAVKVLDAILENNPFDLNALLEKIRIKECLIDKTQVYGQFVAGESLDKVVMRYAREFFATEIRHIGILKDDITAFNAIKTSYLKTQIEKLYNQSATKKTESFGWDDLQSNYFFVLASNTSETGFEDPYDSERAKFGRYLQYCYNDDYHLGSFSSFYLLQDKQHVLMQSESSDGDYKSFILFEIQGRTLIAPRSFSSGSFEFKPSLFNKRYDFHPISRRKYLKHECKIELSQYYHNGYYALIFGNNQTVYFTDSDSKVEERGYKIKYGWGWNGIPLVINTSIL